MRYVAVITDETVMSVVVCNDDDSLDDISAIHDDATTIDVTDVTPRPGPDWLYDGERFIPPAPYPSWTWNGESWEPPIPVPSENGEWAWDEQAQEWVSVALPQ